MNAFNKDWQTNPTNNEIDGKTVHIWRSHFRAELLSDSKFLNNLSKQEIERARRLVRRGDRDRYVFAHATLRRLLASYLDTRPEELYFAANEYGKPFVMSPGDKDICFSLSHSQDMVLVAITRGSPVGVDVEYLRKISDAHGIVNRFFSIEEQDYLNSLCLLDFYEEFFCCWTMKEAYLKGIGKGLSFPLDRFSVMFSNQKPDESKKSHHVSVRVYDWNITTLSPRLGYSGAVATCGAVRTIECFTI